MRIFLVMILLLVSQLACSGKYIKTDKVKLVLLKKETNGKVVEIDSYTDNYYRLRVGIKLKLKKVNGIIIVDSNYKNGKCSRELSQYTHQVFKFNPAITTDIIELMINAPCMTGVTNEANLKVVVRTSDNKTYYNTLKFNSARNPVVHIENKILHSELIGP